MGMQKFASMEGESNMVHDQRKIAVNKRVLCLLVFLLIALPVVVGVLVWYFTSQDKATPLTTSSTSIPIVETTPVPVTEIWKDLRLPRYIVPTHYDIQLYPDFYGDHGWFYGKEDISISIKQETKYILIHFNFLNITTTKLFDGDSGQSLEIQRTFAYTENQFWVIQTKNTLQENSNVTLHLEFDGSLTRAIVGMYKSTYVNSMTGETRHMTSSKFEPVSARRAFPCFDEPNIKSEYTVHLVHQPGYIALSNMPQEEIKPWTEDPSLNVTTFQRSVRMSTYLVCFIVCDFDYLEAKTSTNVTVRTYGTPDRVNQTKFALDVAVTSMELYEKLFNVSYPLPKQDLIAIPDFVSGAMEHWGLITFREVNLLFDPKEASSSNQQRVATVVAHEIAHQWFGNIVTMDWWDDLWLNEGFASFMEYLGAAQAEPSWEMMEQFVTEDVQPVMITDSGTASHPIIVDVTSPDQINEVFDAISYSKGSSVIRMMESIMTRDKFFLGVSRYLKKFRWANAKTDDLWEALGDADDGLSVKDVMDTWTRQMGLPYIDIKYSVTENTATATQRRFLADGSTSYDVSESPYGYKWFVYLNFITETGNTGYHWIPRTRDSITFNVEKNPELEEGAWIKYNHGQPGFYRVKYPDRMWVRFANALTGNTSVLSNVDKSNLIDDALNLARAGLLGYDVALTMTKYLDKETDHLPWESAYSGFSYITSMFRYTGSFGHWKSYILSICKPALERLGWDDSGDHLEKLMRGNLISLACGLGDRDCLNNATSKFRKWLDSNESVAPNLRSLVYKYGMEGSGSEQDWDQMWEKYLSETVPQEKTKLLYGLASTQEIWLLSRYIEYNKNESLVRSQDFFTVLTYISRNPVGNSLVWDWVRQNWDYLVNRFTLFSRSFGRLVPSIIGGFNSDFKLKEVESFFRLYPEAGAGARGRDQSMENIRRNINWMKNYHQTVTDWLKNQNAKAHAQE